MIEHGTIGWSTKDDHAFVGNTAENDGYTMLFVTLFRGRDITKPIKDPKIAEGHRITAMMSSALGRIPPKGTRVLVATPDDAVDGPGMGMVIAYAEKNVSPQLSKNRAVLDFGNQDYVIKARSVTLMDQENRFICLGPDTGVMVQDTDGSGLMVKNSAVALISANSGSVGSIVQLKVDEVTAHVSGGSLMQLNASKATMFGISCYVQGAGVYLGAVPINATQAVYTANSPPATPGVPPQTLNPAVTGISGSVYISP